MTTRRTKGRSKVVGTAGGRPVTEDDIDAMVSEAEVGYDVDELLAAGVTKVLTPGASADEVVAAIRDAIDASVAN